MENHVILVDEQDQEVGTMGKLEAHQKGLLHRAVSVFLFNSSNELLMQRRALGKYHSEGLWTNTCCSHPFVGENTKAAAERRLTEEMGIQCELSPLFHFTYRAELDNNLVENELDHVFIGFSDETPHLNPAEAMSFKWMNLADIQNNMLHFPDHYTEWFKIILREHFHHFKIKQLHESI
jgi:isopentenyl-diphosphate Delta-isomerase